MITELVLFDLPRGIGREEVIAGMHQTAGAWRANAELMRKNYLYDAEANMAGGVYLWPSRAAAERGHDAAWRARLKAMYGCEPVIRYFETPLVVDNVIGRLVEEGAG